jgi:hypothetical protein
VTLEEGLKFLKELRKISNDDSRVGQILVTFNRRKLPEIKDSEKEQERFEGNNE